MSPTPSQDSAPRRAAVECYTPPRDGAECPHCGAAVPGILARFDRAIEMASFFVRCPRCQRSWSEFRGCRLGAARGLHREVRA